MELMAAFRLALGIIGNITEISICLAPMPTFWRIYKNKSVEKFSWLPYATGLLYAAYWGCYALPFITEHNMLLFTVSVAQAVLELIYLIIFLVYSSPKQRASVAGAIFGVAASVAATIAVAKSAMHKRPERCMFAGLPAAIVTVAMYASPLTVMRLVIKTKSVEYMPFLLSFSIFVNSVAWTIYGVLQLDYFILISEGLGAILGTSQLVLYALYRPRKDTSKEEIKLRELRDDAKKAAHITFQELQDDAKKVAHITLDVDKLQGLNKNTEEVSQ
ncbi:bidirectional sugar transporter SWEET1 [Selaginella moellendorffii]|nr:bidirectional sugar transporter SWEET1 [Selaginella moellendorffii]|eukprot:XP_002969669.2 bidirectional sugar transporter SWEET1 [Selaginella moellendorffii]